MAHCVCAVADGHAVRVWPGWAPCMASPGRGEPAAVRGRWRGCKAQGPRGLVTSVLHRLTPRADSRGVIIINTEHSMNANSLKERKVNREWLRSIKNKQRNSRFYPNISYYINI